MSDHRIADLEHRVRVLERQVALLIAASERNEAMALNLSDLIVSLNDNTNAVSARLDHLVAELTAAGTAPTADQLSTLQAISDHLKALGADPNLPVPAPAPAAVNIPTPAPSTPAATSTPPAGTSSTTASTSAPVAITGGTTDPATPPASASSSSTPTT